MRVDLFDFDLPEERIALRPARPRDAARMLVVKPGADLTDAHVRDLPSFLRKGDVLVLNDTRVIPTELHGERVRDGVSAGFAVTLIKRTGQATWEALARGAKKLAAGDRVRFGQMNDAACLIAGLDATVKAKGEAGEVTLAFDLAGPALDEAIAAIGHVPLPPYIAGKRAEDAEDRRDYQTIYAREEGAVAAPTAGLHFTADLFARLDVAGVRREMVTLHVGAGTFLPVKADDTGGHKMHAEWGTVSAATAARLNEARAAGGRIVAVGTTSTRLLESATGEDGVVREFSGDTAIFITPGYRFRAVDVLMTNFHLPRSTLFMLVSAFAGLETMHAAYAHAIASGYRFYSYGDASLLFGEGVR
ncbi:MAG TPA: tRNA preQ1(34) S-adenosylmethionine ribosyltransferase-isomerase QueA [Bauldia sp.]|nr:tRNA preQ1(34) S-adenosylmethionine ribosyltransferase-isomerase QueA [Bauldia sp.]